jgi:MGT family glycosyltransferase
MPEIGHFHRLHSLISGMTSNGMQAHVCTHRMFRSYVERHGGIFFDLFSKYSLEQADGESLPIPCRYVTYAGKYAEPIRQDIEKIKPSLVIHDTFAVIGHVMARLLGIPHVNICAGHNVVPEDYLTALREDPRVKISRRCLNAVNVLRGSYGMTDASPFSYVSSLSPYLNIYCEPPEFLDDEERHVFEPIAFYGSISPLEDEKSRIRTGRSWFGSGSADKLKVYVSFGTVVWRYYAAEALRALNTLSASLADRDDVCAVIGLGGKKIGHKAAALLSRPNVSVENYVDQWEILQQADAFLTHQGMNSTHEAIFHHVPMISYPFFWDQPELAGKCRKLGLAIPLTESPRGKFGKDRVHAVLKRLVDERESMQAALTRAREWEQAVMDKRPAVHQRIIDLME